MKDGLFSFLRSSLTDCRLILLENIGSVSFAYYGNSKSVHSPSEHENGALVSNFDCVRSIKWEVCWGKVSSSLWNLLTVTSLHVCCGSHSVPLKRLVSAGPCDSDRDCLSHMDQGFSVTLRENMELHQVHQVPAPHLSACCCIKLSLRCASVIKKKNLFTSCPYAKTNEAILSAPAIIPPRTSRPAVSLLLSAALAHLPQLAPSPH